VPAPPDRYRHITAAEAETTLGVPSATVRAWAARGKLHSVGKERDGSLWYRLEDVLRLATLRHSRRRSPVCNNDGT
jgi:DNA-binding transcriptional MerR regulator